MERKLVSGSAFEKSFDMLRATAEEQKWRTARAGIGSQAPAAHERASRRATLLKQRQEGDTSPRLGCCPVAAGCCGGNLLRVQWLTAKQTAHGSCGSNLRLPLGELLESTR